MRIATVGTVLQLMRSQGIWKTLKSLKSHLEDKYLDYRLGISTSEIKTKQELGLARDDERPYIPSDYRSFRKLMKILDIHEGRDVFVDFGAGMGRSVIFAGLYPFRRIVGVEISPELCRVAKTNVNLARPKLRCKDIAVVTSDAVTFPIPPDMTVAYFFNPFTGVILDTVLENIRQSLCEVPRQIRFVCNDYSSESQFSRQIQGCHWLLLQKRISLEQKGQIGSIYLNTGIT
jgi:hypothetical protein